jgi:crotonobetainyl-CoA:carnitine CoA-transferase CaiB-like acyl-CoA transferase
VTTAPSSDATPAGAGSGSLDGLLVADFSRVLAGPYATMLLGDLGADVVKVEHPEGDDTRGWGPPWDDRGRSTYYLSVNRNKRSVTLDLRSPDGLRAARTLAARADVLVENLRPGTMERFGLGYADVCKGNAGVLYCSISGFGPKAGAAMPGYDLLAQAMGGLMSVTGPQPGAPTKVGVAMVDVVTGLHAATGILAALQHRRRTGRGQRIEVNLLSSLLSAMVNQASGFIAGGAVPAILGNAHPSIAPYEVLPTADRPLVVAVGNDRQFRAFVTVLGAEGLADDPRFMRNDGRVAHRPALLLALGPLLIERGADAWQAALLAAGVPCGPINDVAEAFALAERLDLQPVADVDGTPTVANPVVLSDSPATYRLGPPALGEHTAEVLGWLDGT